MADYRALAQALDPYAMDTGGITPDTIKALQSGYKSPNLLGMIADIGRGGLSNLESLVRGGVAQFGGTPVDTLNTIRTPYPMEVMGDVNYAPDKQVYGGTKDILGMMPKRVTQARPETAGMEELGTVMGPGLAKAAMPAVRAGQKGLNLLGMEVADRVATGQSVLPSLLKEPQTAMFAVNPADQMAQAVTKAEVSPLGFYSAVEQQALKIPRKQGTGESFLNDLLKGQDVKKYEIEAMGLDTYLKGKPNVTRQEVQDFIATNKLDVQERQLGETITEDPIGIAKRKAVFDKYEPQIQALDQEMQQYETNIINARNLASKNLMETHSALNKENLFGSQPIPTTEDWNRYYLAKAESERVNKIPLNLNEFRKRSDSLHDARDAEANAAYVVPESTPTKYDKFQLPGGENYRELLLTLPDKKNQFPDFEQWITNRYGGEQVPENVRQAAKKEYERQNAGLGISSGYQSSHFNEPNILAHMRVNDRVDAESKKMLLIEEVQSDWHQAGRERGYVNPESKKALEVESKTIANERNSLVAELVKQEKQNGFVSLEGQQRWDMFKEKEEAFKQKSKDFSSQVPDAPFKDTWHQLALKRAIKEAVDKGYDRIGLTTGKRQIERYTDELRQNVDEINFNPIGTQNEIIVNAKKDGKKTFSGTVKNGKFIEGPNKALGKTLEEVLGKTIAKQIEEKKDGVIKGKDLTIGGEGMKKYYDEVYPNYLDKLGKKYGARVGETNVLTSKPAYVDYIVGPGNFNDTTVLGVRSDGSTTILNQNANSMEEAQQLVNRYKKEKNLGGGGEPVRYLDITPEMRKAIKEGQPLASIEEELAKVLA